MTHFSPNYLIAAAIVAAVIIGLGLGYIVAMLAKREMEDGDPFDDSAQFGDDPWEMQRELMRISGQHLPDRPALTKASFLYVALTLEELSEMIEALASEFIQISDVKRAQLLGVPRDYTETIHKRLTDVWVGMGDDALKLRALLEPVKEFEHHLTVEQAHMMFDGTTDVAVVNCGFALACGLPGSDGYKEVVLSNISKRNPDTGMIDKTADGKWIKGAEYRAPNLLGVLKAAEKERQRREALSEALSCMVDDEVMKNTHY